MLFCFLLFHDKTNAQVLPKRFFSVEGIVAFREIIRTNVKKVRLRS
jgi:YcxB-like protein